MATLGIIGLGQMGIPVAARLIAAGHSVMGTTLGSPPAAFGEDGGQFVASVSQLASAQLVISLVTDDAATRDIALGPDGIASCLGPGVIHIAMGSLSPDLCHALAAGHAAVGQGFLAAPVFGRPDAAAVGQLTIVCAGDQAMFAAAEPVLRALGKCRWIGEESHLSNLVKLAGNQMIFAAVEMLGEVFAFFRKAGISEQEVPELLLSTLFPGPIFAGYAQRIQARDWAGLPRGLQIASKDNRHFLAAAAGLGAELPLFELLQTRLAAAAALTPGDADLTALARATALDCGLPTDARAADERPPVGDVTSNRQA